MVSIINGKLGEFYTNEDGFKVGKALKDSNDFVLLALYDPQGRWDGYFWMKKDPLYEVAYDTPYIRKMELYIEYWEKKENYSSSIEVNDSVSGVIDILKIAQQENKIIEIERIDEDETDIGYVTAIGEDTVDLSCINFGTAEFYREISVSIDEILYAAIDSPDYWVLEYAYSTLKKK